MSIQVGIAGAGNIATSRHLPAFVAGDRFEVAAIYDRKDKTASRVADEFDLPTVESFEALCERANLVSLCTPPEVHCDQAVRALAAGCHVLTEKPMAMSSAEAEDMARAAQEHDRVLSVVQNFLFMDAVERARCTVESGLYGDVVRTYMLKPESEQKRGKAYLKESEAGNNHEIFRLFWDEAAHLVYLTQEFAGDVTVTDATYADAHGSKGVIRARMDGDAEGSLTMILDAPISEWWFAIVCERGLLLVDIYRDMLLTFDDEPDHSALRVLAVLVSAILQLTTGGAASGLRYVRDRLGSGHRIPDAGFSRQLDGLETAITGESDPPVTAAQGKSVVDVMQAIAEAASLPGAPEYSTRE